MRTFVAASLAITSLTAGAYAETRYLYRSTAEVIETPRSPANLVIASAAADGAAVTPDGRTNIRVTVTNTGERTSGEVGAPAVSGPFRVVSTNCAGVLVGRAACSAEIEGVASANGALAGTVSFPGIVGGLAISGTARGFDPALRASTYEISGFTATPTTQSTGSLTLTNRGKGFQPAFAPSVAGSFVVAGHTCGSGLAPDASCSVTVRGAVPTVSGPFTGALNAPTLDRTVALSGTATTQCTTVGGVCPDGTTYVGATNGKHRYVVTSFNPRVRYSAAVTACSNRGMVVPSAVDVGTFADAIAAAVGRADMFSDNFASFMWTSTVQSAHQRTFAFNRPNVLRWSSSFSDQNLPYLCITPA